MLLLDEARTTFRSNFGRIFKRRSNVVAGRTAKHSDLVSWGRRAMPHYFTLPSSAMHRYIGARMVCAAFERGYKDDYEAPRGSAKSTIVTTVYPTFAGCEKLEDYIMLFAETTPQSRRYLEAIATEFTENEYIEQHYPEVFGEGPTWNKGCLVLKNGVRIEANGAGRRVRGARSGAARPSCVIVDDAEGDDAAFSRVKRNRIRDWFTKAIMNLGNTKTNYFVNGTRVHGDNLTAHLSKQPGWMHKMFRALMQWPERMDLWAEWEAIYGAVHDKERDAKALKFYVEHRGLMDLGARVLWPENENLYQLMCKRATDGYASFESEKQNNPIDPSKCEWGDEYFKNDGIYFDEWPTDNVIKVKTSSLDASKGIQDETADYQAMIDIALTNDGDVWVDSDLSRRPLDEMCAEYVNRITLHNSDGAVVEDNQFQELLLDDLELESNVVNSPVPITGMTNTKKKIVRIRRLGPLITRGRIHFKRQSRGNALLIKQLAEFPNADHDDGPDALEMAIRHAYELLAGDAEDVVLPNTY